MTSQYALLYCFLVFSFTSFAQADVSSVVGNDFPQGFNPVDEIPLFNKQEIKKKGFKTAYVVYHPPAWTGDPNENACSYNDTLTIFRFDEEGRIVEETQLKTLGMFGETRCYDSSGKWIKRISMRRYDDNRVRRDTFLMNRGLVPDEKNVIIRSKSGNDSIITTLLFEKYDTGFDTSFVQVQRYDSKRRLLEHKDYETKKFIKEFGCSTDSYHHEKYAWDNENRLVYYRNMLSSDFQKISYPPYGKLSETYDNKTGKLLNVEPKLISDDHGIITIQTSSGQTTMVPCEKNSKLYKLKAVTSSGEFPITEYFEITYK